MLDGAEKLANVVGLLVALLLLIGIGKFVVSLTRGERSTNTWDFFFSYKSENANEVRRIAERLMAGGYRVWFAEYEILLRNFDDFEPWIRQGIDNCSYAILFTTPDYWQSRYCQDEAEWLKQRFATEPQRIIEVSLQEPNVGRHAGGISPQSPRVVTKISPQASAKPNEDDELLIRLSSLTGLDLSRISTSRHTTGDPRWYTARCAPVSFQAQGFVLLEWNTYSDGTDVFSFDGEPGAVKYGFNVYFHYFPERAPGEPFTLGDDRKLYAELRAFAQYFIGQVEAQGADLEERGLHLFWRAGRPQMALTHTVSSVPMRKYSVILQELPAPLQVIFTFSVAASFDEFVQYMPLMDRVVESIRVGR